MDKSESVDPYSNKEDNNLPDSSGRFDKKFNIQLTVSQAQLINTLLPKRYTLTSQRQIKTKRTSKKKNTQSKKQASQMVYDFEQPSQRTKKVPNRYNEQIVELNNYSRASSQGFQQMDDTLKPCMRILNLLKSHKNSWPFKTPVDPVVLNIPNYFEIIKEPMDLQTVQQNLKNRVYITPTQFHADINKIIHNSYQFNKDNPAFMKLTQQFERYYKKISNEPQKGSLNNISADMRKKSKQNIRGQMGQGITLQQKRQLAIQIRKLPKHYLLEVAQLVYKDKAPTSQQLNLDALSSDRIRELQKLVREKLAYLQVNSQGQKKQQQKNNENRQQSSFEDESES